VTEQETPARSSPECLVCPLCLGMAAMRQARPEAMEHLLKAGAELLEAVRALVDPGTGEQQRPGGVQRIDIG
jgi:adenine-specific DNA glycosylase